MTCVDKIKWLFFNMGSTLMDESKSYQAWFRNASDLVGGALSAREIEAEYCAGMSRGSPTLSGQLRAYGFTGSNVNHLYPSALDTPYPDAQMVLEQLHKVYRLGIIANQNAGAQARLRQYGLLHYFDVVAASAEAGFSKPDSRLFLLALKQAGCRPEQAVMIGDRLDNDIYPANALGFITVRIVQGYGGLQIPKSPAYEPDFTIDALDRLLDLF